ncbi:MAG: ABC transporter substrate-binding protein [Burkholderiales bacterium]|nr:ABC transporter substrate-binding protein [Burkholderiales bacterium]
MTLRPFLSTLLPALLAVAASLAAAQNDAGPILVGQSGGFTGGQAAYAADVRNGIEAAFAGANAAGGVNGRTVKLVTADDGGTRDKVLANTRKLVESDNVVALIGYTSGAGTEITLPYIKEARVPILSPATGNMGIRAEHNPWLFHTRAGYRDEMAKIVGHATGLGLKPRVALAYLGDVGPANLKSMQDALVANQLSAAAVVSLDRNAADFTPQINQLMAGRPDLVIFISNAPPIVKIVTGMRERGYYGQFATSSFSGSRVVDELKQHARGLIMIQVLPQPHKNALAFHRDFHTDLKRLPDSAKANANYTVLEGYIAGRTLIEGLKKAGKDLTRDKLTAALSGMNELDFSGYRIRYARGNHEGSRFVDLGVVTADGNLKF